MLIGEKYKIESDVLNVTLYQKRIMTGERVPSAKGNVVWQAIAYFSNPKNALESLVNYEIMGTGLEDLKTVCDKTDELYKLIQAIPDNILPQLEKR